MSFGEEVISIANGVLAPDVRTAVRRAVQSCIDALPAHIAILDVDGDILAVNARWTRFAESNNLIAPRHGLGENYLAVCDAAARAGDAAAAEVAAGRDLVGAPGVGISAA